MLYLRRQVTLYVILFIERDGSTYLTSMLMSHPDFQAVYERFSVLKQEGASAVDQLTWARDFFTPPLIGKKAAIGFKTKLVDVLDPEGFARLLLEKRCHVIQMQRRNRVKAVVSRINARRLYETSGNWNLYKESDRMPPMKIEIGEFDQFLKEREQADEALDDFTSRLSLPKLKIVYEDLQLNKNDVMQKIYSFLHVRNWPVEGKTLKHTRDDLREVVLNFDDLRGHYSGTAYEAMFDEILG